MFLQCGVCLLTSGPWVVVTAPWNYWLKNKEEKHLNEFWLWCALDSVSVLFFVF